VGRRSVTRDREREYTAPRLYEIAFDMNRKGEVDFLTHCFKRFARRRVRDVLDIACGTGPHLIRLADRGYRMSGLDLSRSNIEFLRQRLAAGGHTGELVVGDMTDFRLRRQVDAAICMQDSQGHLLTNEQLVSHLRSVARAVRPGGLYVFDRYMVSSWTDPARRWSWSRRRGNVIVRASFSALNDVDPVTQVFTEHMVLEAIENGSRRVYRQTHRSRMLFPQELKALVALAGGFEFVQWFFGFKPHQVLERSRHPLLMVVVLRRTR
jgi:SAM-dependent methyltransferase